MERSKKRNVLLEYFPKEHHFHYNFDMYDEPSECYLPLGWASMDEADIFTRIVQPLITKYRYDEPEVSFDRVKESFDNFCYLIEHDKISLFDYHDTSK